MSIDSTTERSPEEEAATYGELKTSLETHLPEPSDDNPRPELLIPGGDGPDFIARRIPAGDGHEIQILRLQEDQVPGQLTVAAAEMGFGFNDAGELTVHEMWDAEKTPDPDAAATVLQRMKDNPDGLQKGTWGDFYGTGPAK